MVSRKRGAMVNMGSGAGVSVSPLLAQYGAAKSYVAMFSKAMNAELASFGIHVQCQVPLFVATKLAKIKHASLFVASPSGYARAAVACTFLLTPHLPTISIPPVNHPPAYTSINSINSPSTHPHNPPFNTSIPYQLPIYPPYQYPINPPTQPTLSVTPLLTTLSTSHHPQQLGMNHSCLPFGHMPFRSGC